jgi:hypothetical protein
MARLVQPVIASFCVSMALGLAAAPALGDEGGASFWIPGQMGSFAAVPTAPGLTLPVSYYHASQSATGGKEFTLGSRVIAGLHTTSDVVYVAPAYAFSPPEDGPQFTLGITAGLAHVRERVDATLSGPGGAEISGEETDSVNGLTDLYPSASVRWNLGLHNVMAYAMAGAPAGSYDKHRLANIGTNHWSLDGGLGYTYLDTRQGHEFSAVLGWTKNQENPDTHYKNGNDMHLDWAASQFFSQAAHVGLVGYFYDQIGSDSGAGATLGPFKSRVAGAGGEVGWFWDSNGHKYYLNFRMIGEFDAANRPSGWNLWLTMTVPLT